MSRIGKPAAVKEAQGNPGHRPIAKEGPAAPIEALSPPKNLKGRARVLWDQLAPELAAQRLLRRTDLGSFRRYCVLLAKWDQAEDLLKKAHLVHTTSSPHVENMERVSKALMVAIMIDKRLTEIEDRFGMNPAARQRLMLQLAAGAGQGSLPLGGQDQDSLNPPPPTQDPLPASPIGLLGSPPAGNC